MPTDTIITFVCIVCMNDVALDHHWHLITDDKGKWVEVCHECYMTDDSIEMIMKTSDEPYCICLRGKPKNESK